jgi:hypothetical protein
MQTTPVIVSVILDLQLNMQALYASGLISTLLSRTKRNYNLLVAMIKTALFG